MIPIPIDTNKTVAAFEFRPGNRKVVHHALLYLDNTGAARALTNPSPAPATPASAAPASCRPADSGLGPGSMPRMLPDGMGKFLRKGSDLVLQIHYHPDGKPEKDQSVVGIYFTKKPAQKIVAGIAVRTRNLDIPAGEHRFHTRPPERALPVDVQAIGVAPTCTISARK